MQFFILLVLAGFLVYSCFNVKKYNLTDWGSPFLNFMDGLNRLFCEKYHRLNRVVIDLPESGPAIVVSNHISGLDPLLLISSARRPLRFLIAREEYERFGLNWLFRAVGCIPVDRKARGDMAFRAALKALQSNQAIAIFPIGKIHLHHEPVIKLKSGAASLAKKFSCPVTVTQLSGVAQPGHVVRPVLLRGNAQIKTGLMMQTTDMNIEDINRKIIEKISFN